MLPSKSILLYNSSQLAAKDGLASLVEVVTAKDFALSSFQVTINKIQQLALDKASEKIPCPEDQLQLIRERRSKKTKEKSNLSLYDVFRTVLETEN